MGTRFPSVDPTASQLAQRLKTRHLTLLVQLDAQRSVLAASQACGMSQPAASKLLAEMEQLLGVELFERHARGVEPTGYGRLLIRRARNALTELRQAQAEIAALRSGLAGHVAIGTVITSATQLVPLAVARLKQRHPQIVVSIEVDYSEVLTEHLAAGRLDMAIARIHGLAHDESLAYEALVENPHSVFARSGHPLAARRRVGLHVLAQQSWVLPPPGNVLRDRLAVIFSEQGLALPLQGVETAALPVITSLLHESDMVSVLADEVVQAECSAGVLVRLAANLPLLLGAAGIVTRREHLLAPAAREVLRVLRETAGLAGPAFGSAGSGGR